MGPFDIWSQLQALQPPNQYGQPQPVPGSPDPAVTRQEGLDGGHGNDGSRGRRPGPPSKPRWREMDWGDRLTALGAIVGDLDPRMQGQGYRAFREEYAGRGQADLARQQAQAQLERQQAFRDAYAASLDENGNIDPAKLQRNLAPFVSDIGDITALNGLGPKPERIMMGDFTGPDGVPDGVPDLGYESAVRARLGPPGGAPQAQPQGLPPLPPGLTLVNPNQAAPVRAATPQGQGFSNYGEITSFLTSQFPGSRITSTSRPQSVQDDLYRRGKTPTRNSTHVEGRGLGTDFVPAVPFSQWPEVARQLEATGRFRRVRVESGQGRNQGTGAHIHLEPR